MTVLQRKLLSHAGVLFFIGMLTGLWAAVVLTHGAAAGGLITLHPVHERLALAAHLNGLLGTFWLIAIVYTLEHLDFSERGKMRLAWLVVIAAYGNWAVTLLASVLGVRGLDFGGSAANQMIAGLLQIFVVIPTLLASGAWAYGLVKSR